MALGQVAVRPALVAVLALTLVASCGLAGRVVPGLAGGTTVDLDSLPRDKIEAFGTPILRAVVPGAGVDVLLSVRDTNGGVVTWESAEGITFAFRDGMLIETRGLGADLMSARAPSASSVASGAASRRSYWAVGDDDVNLRRDYDCAPQSAGTETVEIYGRAHATRVVEESCVGTDSRMKNKFWFEGGQIRQSRQFVSPDAGHAFFFRIVD